MQGVNLLSVCHITPKMKFLEPDTCAIFKCVVIFPVEVAFAKRFCVIKMSSKADSALSKICSICILLQIHF